MVSSTPAIVATVVGILLPGRVVGKRCFQSNEELRDAVESYLQGSPSTKVRTKIRYGWKIGCWCLGRVTSLDSLFFDSPFNEDISRWDVSRVKYMNFTFAFSEFNGDISKWKVSAVEDMSFMFYSNNAFNSDISKWNVAAVKPMSYMFAHSGFNGDISKWDVAAVEYMSYMFFNATSYSQNLCPWSSKTNNLLSAENMFALTNCPVESDPDLTAVARGPFCYSCE
jgi:surface protein